MGDIVNILYIWLAALSSQNMSWYSFQTGFTQVHFIKGHRLDSDIYTSRLGRQSGVLENALLQHSHLWGVYRFLNHLK